MRSIKIQRLLIIKLHAIRACFFMPIARLYFVSGELYSFDIKGAVDKQVYTLALDRPFTPDLALLTETVTTALEQRNLTVPTGDPAIPTKKSSYEYAWGICGAWWSWRLQITLFKLSWCIASATRSHSFFGSTGWRLARW